MVPAPAPARLSPLLGGRAFESPVQMVRHPVAPHWYVVEQGGKVFRVDGLDASVAPPTLVADFSPVLYSETWEAGLLGLAIRPDFEQVPEVFVKYTTGTPERRRLVVMRVQVSPQTGRFDLATMQEVVGIDQQEHYHHGGPPGFGSDGLLYVPFGDGGFLSLEDAQNARSFRGDILRLDIRTRPYAIPSDNPQTLGGVRSETFATGFRNPHGWQFDSRDGTLWVGDVGESRFEELDHVKAGDNHGWPIYEGFACRMGDLCTQGFDQPTYAYGRSEGATIIGGPRYRGKSMPWLLDQVLFGDFTTGEVRAVRVDAGEPPTITTLIQGGSSLASFSEDEDGEVLVVDRASGSLFRLVEAPVDDRGPARTLLATGCVDPENPARPAEGFMPFEVRMPLWSDGADKERAFALPPGTKMKLREDGTFDMPVGSIVTKLFRLNGRPIETRFLLHHAEGWRGFSYRWREDGSDADLLDGAADHEWEGQTWSYPSPPQCFQCHSTSSGFVRGLTLSQLNFSVDYPGTQLRANQLSTMRHLGLFDDEVPDQAPMPSYEDTKNAAAWSKAYLDVNCSGCHRPGGPAFGEFDLRWDVPVSGYCDTVPTVFLAQQEGARIIAPGSPERSILLTRLMGDPLMRMPPLASNLHDHKAHDVLSRWIRGMDEKCR